jgi:hypothetical protein
VAASTTQAIARRIPDVSIAAGDVKLKPKELKWKAEEPGKNPAVVAVVEPVVARR